MKKVLAVLVALAMLVTFASATTQFDYIKTVYIDPNHFATLPAGYSITDAQYSMIKMVAQPDGQISSQSAYSKVEVGTSQTTDGHTVDAFVKNGLQTSIVGDTDGVSKQLIYQNGEVYYGSKPVVYDAQNPPETWQFQNWAGYSRDQGAVFSGDLDCPTKTFTVIFNDDNSNPQASVKFGDHTLVESMSDDMAVQVGATGDGVSLGEAFGGMSAAAEATYFPQQALSQIPMTDMDFEASFIAGGMADLGCEDKVFVDFNPANINGVGGSKTFTWDF